MKVTAQSFCRYPSYPEYKDSGVDWLREIPSHWMVQRLKTTVTGCQNGLWGDEPDGVNDISCIRVADFDRQSLCVDFSERTLRALDERTRQGRLLKKGDLLIEKSGGGEKQSVGCVVLYDYEETAICSNFIARMPAALGYCSRYLVYLHAAAYSARLNNRSIKQSTGIQNLDSESYLNELACSPPFPEQQTIAAFLDRETSKIDALVAKKERLIELLQEKRDTFITQAVTKGLDQNASMKDTGVEWLEELPAHWDIASIKRTARRGYKTFTDGDWIELPFIADEGIRLIQTGNVGVGDYKEQGFRYITPESFSDLRCTEVHHKDVLICRLDGPVGRACLAPKLGIRMITSVDNTILKVDRTRNEPRFLVYFMTSLAWLNWIQAICRVGGGFRFRVSRSMLGDQKISLPPLQEQQMIADFLDAESERARNLTSRIQAGIDCLKDLRTALISAAVTGKMDVREEAT